MTHVNPKTELNQFLQRLTQRPITKQDILFETQQYPGQGYQCMLTIQALGGEAFNGELGQSEKEAEQNAARQALITHADEIAQLASQPKKGTKRTAAPAVVGHVAGSGMAHFAMAHTPMGKGAKGGKLFAQVKGKGAMIAKGAKGAKGFGVAVQSNFIGKGGKGCKGKMGGVGIGMPAMKRAKVEPGWGAPVQSQPPKLVLNGLVMKLVRRALTKGEISYETVEIGVGQHQSTVKLPELPGVGLMEYNGHPLGSAKEAEHSAAEIAVESLREDPEIQALEATNPQKTKSASAKAEATDPISVPAKTQLNTLVMKVVRRALAKGEISYETVEIEEGQHQATVKLPELPGVGLMEFNGHPLGSAKEAEHSAAEMALESLREDPEIQGILATIPQKPQKTKSAAGGGPGAAMALLATQPVKGKGKAKGAKGKTKAGGPDLARTRVLDTCTGKVADWKGAMGWIVSDVPVEHEKAELRGGRLYVHLKDCGGNALAKDMEVTFAVYEDETGLGAEEVAPM